MKRTKTTLKSYFETGDKPSQTEYSNLIDSLRHLDDKIPLTDLEEEVAKKNEDNQFPTTQTFNQPITVNGIGDSVFNTSLVLNDALTTNAGIDAYGNSSFDSNLEVNGLLSSNTGLNIQFPLTALDVASQSVGSITVANNSSGAEAPTIAGKTDLNSPGLQFIASTRDTAGTLADMVFNVRENNNTDFTNELDTIGFQFRRFATPLINIYRNGKQENLFGLNVQSSSFDVLNLERTGTTENVQISFNHNGGTAYLGFATDETLRFGSNTNSALNGQIWTSNDAPTFEGLITVNAGIRTDQILSTSADTDLRITPHGTGNIHFGNSGNGNKLFHYSQLNDGKYTSFYHNSTQSVFDTTSINGFLFEKKVTVNGDIQPSGNYLSSDGTPGYNGNFTVGVYDITVKDGLITNVVNIS